MSFTLNFPSSFCLPCFLSICTQFKFYCSDKASAADNPQETDLVKREVKLKDPGLWRDLGAYWIFGLCNNFGYVVMLTAVS